ncbi:MAG: hypothetical protein ACPG77_08450 [Nannocystaceae bacterium]
MKKLLPLTFLGALALGAFTMPAAGCGDACVNACEDAKDCDGADQNVDCQKTCDDARKASEDAGCGSEYDDAQSACSGGGCEATEISDACVDASTKYGTCLLGAAE